MNFEGISLFLKRIRFVYAVSSLLVLNFIVFVLIVVPEKQKISSLQEEYSEQRHKIQEEKKSLRDLESRLSSLQKADADLKRIFKEVLSSKTQGVTEIREELEELAGTLGVDRSNVDYRYELMPDLGLRRFVLSVPVEGNYRDIRHFINEIERSSHFLILDRVDLSTERETQSGESLILSFQLSTYLTDEELKKDAENAKNKRTSGP